MKNLNYFKIESRIFKMSMKNKAFTESLLKDILYLLVERLAVQQELNHLRHRVTSRQLETRKNKTHYDEVLRTINVLEFELQDLNSRIEKLRGIRKEVI